MKFPKRYEIRQDPAISLEVSIDPESATVGQIFFLVEQDTSEIVLTLESAKELLEAITDLYSTDQKLNRNSNEQ